jgi:hypothetical protein
MGERESVSDLQGPSPVAAEIGAEPAIGPAAPRAGARLSPSGVLALQRTAGNTAVVSYLQRSGAANASRPPPASSEAADPEVLRFEGAALRFDHEVLYRVLSAKAARGGLMAPAEFVGRLRNANPLTLLSGSERPGLYHDILRGLDDATLRLDHERDEFCKTFESTAGEVALGLLDKTKQTIEAELTRLGITGDVIRDPSGGGVPDFKLSNAAGAAGLKLAARDLIPLAKAVDAAAAASAAATQKLGESQGADPFNLTNKPLIEDEQAKRKTWLEASEAYEGERRTKVAAQPVLAMYAAQPGAAARLAELAAKDDRSLANDIGMESRQRLSNVEMVRGEIGKRFSVWNQPHLRRVTLDQMQATPVQRESVDWKVREKQRQEADDKMLFTLLAVGLGLLAAIPTGGSSLMAGVAVAAAAAGAGLSLYQLGESGAAYSLAVAANATDFDKAKAISQNEPDGMQLALDCVAAVADVFGAAAAYKTLRSALAVAEAGGIKALPKLMAAADEVGLSAASKGRLAAKTLDRAGGPRAVQEMIQAIRDGIMKAGAGSDPGFIGACRKAADTLIGEGRLGFVRTGSKGGTLNEIERVLINAGEVEPEVSRQAKLIAKDFADSQGVYIAKYDIVLLREGDDLANVLVHELAHRGQHMQKKLHTIGTMRREYQAYSAEQQFLQALPDEAVPLGGDAKWLRNATPEEIEQHIRLSYKADIAEDLAGRPNLQALDRDADAALIIDWFKKLGGTP